MKILKFYLVGIVVFFSMIGYAQTNVYWVGEWGYHWLDNSNPWKYENWDPEYRKIPYDWGPHWVHFNQNTQTDMVVNTDHKVMTLSFDENTTSRKFRPHSTDGGKIIFEKNGGAAAVNTVPGIYNKVDYTQFFNVPIQVNTSGTIFSAEAGRLEFNSELAIGANDIAFAGDVTIGSQATINGSGNITKKDAGTLTINGQHANYSGSIIIDGGTVILAAENTIPDVCNVYVNSGNLIIRQTQTLKNIIVAENGSVTIEDGKLVMNEALSLKRTKSTATEVSFANTDIDITGTINIEVEFEHADRWQFISFPFPIKSIKKSNGELAVYRDDYEMRIYDVEKRIANKSGWVDVTAEAIPVNQPLPDGMQAYIIWSDKETLIFEADIENSKSALGDNATTNLSYSEAPFECNSGWNFVTHPLVSKITAPLSTGHKHYKYKYDVDEYATTDYIESETILNPLPFESYFIQVTEDGVLNFGNTQQAQMVARRQAVAPIERIKLGISGENHTYTTLIRVIPESTTGYDAMYDASHTMAMLASTPQIYSFGDNVKCAINSIPEKSELDFGVRVPAAGEYILNWETELYSQKAVLYDKIADATIDLSVSTEYMFHTTTKGEINNRFSILFSDKGSVTTQNKPETYEEFEIYVSPGKIIIAGLEEIATIRLFDLTGYLVLQETANREKIQFTPSDKGIYILQLEYAGKIITRKVLVGDVF